MMRDDEYDLNLLTLNTLVLGMGRLRLDEMADWVTTMETFTDLDAEMVEALASAGRTIAAAQFVVNETLRGAGL